MSLGQDEGGLRAWRAFLNAHALVIRRVEAALQAEELPPLGWYDVLWALYRADGRRLRIHELSEEVVLSRTGMSRLVDRIETAGMLRREPVPEDGRGSYAAITEEGVELLRRMWPVYARGVEQHFAAPLGDDADALRESLERIAATARQVTAA